MSTSWEPANDTERAMAQAVAAGDRQEYFRLLALAPLYLPQRLSDVGSGAGQRLMTGQLFGHTFLFVFTSLEGLASLTAAAADGYTETTYAELRRKWPDPLWRLAVNVGSPIDAYLPVESVPAAALGEVTVPTVAEVVAESATDEENVDVDAYLRSLLDSVVLVPVTREVPHPNAILEPNFPWLVTGAPQAPVIEIFTAEELLAQAHPGPVPSVPVALPVVLSMWPPDHDLALDPGTPQRLDLPADQVAALLLWADDEGAADGEGTVP